MKAYYLFLTLAIARPVDALAQGTFRNMDFEQSQIAQNQPRGLVSAGLAFPSWNVYYGTSQQTQVYWNQISAGSTEVSLIGQLDPDPVLGGPSPLDGGYSAILVGGLANPTTPLDCSMSQVGQLPTDAVSLLFKAAGSGQLTVSVGGVSLPVFDVASGPNYSVYGVNVSQFAGMQEDLRFTAPGYSANGPNGWEIDDIVFSTTPVPEPTTPALLATGALIFAFWTFKQKW